ncbi:hypothetical protein BKA65DRAFT_494934 [Rhexocercosporidium sp. MPI-PUGE-AT-0058]|nr:hypothetical protein BKA65DRAFT_494934 [Rhexocercosporidium sp. MPI-PUGE-AT-0058]
MAGRVAFGSVLLGLGLGRLVIKALGIDLVLLTSNSPKSTQGLYASNTLLLIATRKLLKSPVEPSPIPRFHKDTIHSHGHFRLCNAMQCTQVMIDSRDSTSSFSDNGWSNGYAAVAASLHCSTVQ